MNQYWLLPPLKQRSSFIFICARLLGPSLIFYNCEIFLNEKRQRCKIYYYEYIMIFIKSVFFSSAINFWKTTLYFWLILSFDCLSVVMLKKTSVKLKTTRKRQASWLSAVFELDSPQVFTSQCKFSQQIFAKVAVRELAKKNISLISMRNSSSRRSMSPVSRK